MNLLKALAAVSSLTLVSRILAFVRDVLIARIFGAGMVNDAYIIATRLPNLLRRLFAEGAFSQAFVPIFGEYNKRRGHDETKLLVDHVTTMLALVLFVVTLTGIVAAPLIVYFTAPGFVQGRREIQPDRAAAAHHFALHLLHFAGIGGGRHAQHLQQILGTGVCAHPAECLFDRRRVVAGPAISNSLLWVWPGPGSLRASCNWLSRFRS